MDKCPACDSELYGGTGRCPFCGHVPEEASEPVEDAAEEAAETPEEEAAEEASESAEKPAEEEAPAEDPGSAFKAGAGDQA